MKIYRNIILRLLSLPLIVILIMLVSSALLVSADNNTSAKTKFKLSVRNIVFDSEKYYSTQYIYNDSSNTSSHIEKAVSSNKKVCTVTTANSGRYETGEKYVSVKAVNAGKANVTVTDNLGRKVKVNVTVTKGWRKPNFTKGCYLGGIYYSSKSVYVYGLPETKITFKIGGDTYKKKIKKNSTYTEIKLKKHYKVGAKYKAVFKKGNLKKTVKGKVISCTSVSSGTVWSCKNYVPVTAYYVTKGDKVIIEAGGKSYKKKVTADAYTFNTTFYLDKSCGNYSWLYFKVKNKHGQVLYSSSRYLNWR